MHNKFSTVRIKKLMLDRGYSVKALAKTIGRPRQTVSTAINNARRFPRVRQELLEVLTHA